MISRLSTAHFRTPADYRGQFLPDHYPVGINRESIRAGTVIFDHLGHIAVVYKVTDDGRVHFIDAHPDNSLTRGTYDSEMERAGPETGSGFRRWRPQRLVGATIGPDGTLSGGTVELTADKDLPDWSDEQYFGAGAGRAADWRDARFAFNGQPIDYFGYVRMTLARPGFKFSPVDEVRARIDSMCQEIRYRVDAVDAAVRAGINRKPQPLRFPRNIYVTQGYWEAYATPSRDAQLKKMFKLLREEIERFIMLHDGRSTLVTYSGANLRADLRKVYETASGACAIAYTKSDGTSHKLTFADVKERLFKLSFDPHHCVELRWGASDPEELKSCPDGAVKKAWYDGQQRLRNQLVRTIGDRMDFTLADLARQAREESDVGENEPPLVEVWTLLASAGID